ncbi:hypothetical protein BCR37DRAFT_143482 [Protomyces lactucae-debilis]|uniref:Uncharacterized protein n=1 Tax=Protomyces lactucae-debilis TaxID=2754530 RepID=A0A1Y2FSU9_PROLT|nr:uncharacterized protein BCR37DRAFT_143482 [Protomyces lactucae-debilis]ORY87083.1 hypothetical protein BCR37DRAFT_143482 [Protomyces lactucae-debilis]
MTFSKLMFGLTPAPTAQFLALLTMFLTTVSAKGKPASTAEPTGKTPDFIFNKPLSATLSTPLLQQIPLYLHCGGGTHYAAVTLDMALIANSRHGYWPMNAGTHLYTEPFNPSLGQPLTWNEMGLCRFFKDQEGYFQAKAPFFNKEGTRVGDVVLTVKTDDHKPPTSNATSQVKICSLYFSPEVSKSDFTAGREFQKPCYEEVPAQGWPTTVNDLWNHKLPRQGTVSCKLKSGKTFNTKLQDILKRPFAGEHYQQWKLRPTRDDTADPYGNQYYKSTKQGFLIGVDLDRDTAMFGETKDRPRLVIEGVAESKVEIREPTELTEWYIFPDTTSDAVNCTFIATSM